jgi:nucleoside-diphosphate-sugar epimerase
MALPRIIVTGSSGFIGRHLLDALKQDHHVIGMARRSQFLSNAPVHENISWKQVDIARPDQLAAACAEVREEGPVDMVIHLAAHYDFTGDDHPEYQRTNIDGLRYVLDECRILRPRRFVFSSSVAACAFPRTGDALNELSLPDGDHIYARTKAQGEAMLAEYRDSFPSVIVRFAALFSDWCEYPPLYMFLRTWLSRAWNRRILGGRGESAIPYLHVKDAMSFLRRVIARVDDLDDGEILIASGDGCTSHRELYDTATTYWNERAEEPLFTPRLLVRPGIQVMSVAGRFMKERPFERPWMADYVDQRMTIDSSRSRRRLAWSPRERLHVLRRLPYLLENRRGDRIEWTRRNRDAMKQFQERPCLAIYYVLQRNKDEIAEACTRELSARYPSYAAFSAKEHEWNHSLFLRMLFNAVRTRERVDFMSYCRELAMRRLDEGFDGSEVLGALQTVDDICVRAVVADPEGQAMLPHVHHYLSMTVQYGIDQVREAIEDWRDAHPDAVESAAGDGRG